MHPHDQPKTRSLSKDQVQQSSSFQHSDTLLKNYIGNANYRFLIGQIVTCLVFIIYTVLAMMVGESNLLVDSFLVRTHYFETVLLLIVILIPIYFLFSFVSILDKRSNTQKQQQHEESSPSDLLIQIFLKYFGVLLGGAFLVYVVVTLFGFTPFMRITSSLNNFQSARSDVESSPNMNHSAMDSNWICAKKNIPASIMNSENYIVFSFLSKCHIFSIDELKCCIVWCIISSLVVFVQPMSTLLQWNNIREYINLVVFEKTARVSSISFNLKPVGPLRQFILVHVICIWISGFVIPLDWEKDWQYFPLCTTVGLIFGSISNLILTLMKEEIKED